MLLIAAFPKRKAGEYDLKTLSELAVALKEDYPDANDASVLLEPEIAYDHLIRVMDAIRSAEAPALAEPSDAGRGTAAAQARVARAGDPRPLRVALFTDIAVGDAP